MKVYRRHNCDRAHRSSLTMARCIWRRAHWVLGRGPYASVSRCRGTTVALWATVEEAEAAKVAIDALACGGACVRRHEVIQIGTPGRVSAAQNVADLRAAA